MTFEGLEEICEGDSADMNTGKLILVLMRSRAEGLMCACPCARTPIGVSGNYVSTYNLNLNFFLN